MAKANKSSTRTYIEFNKAELHADCVKIGSELDKLNAAAGKVREAYVASIEKHHGDVIKAAAPNGTVYEGLSLNFGKLSGIYDLPGASKAKSSSKAISLK